MSSRRNRRRRKNSTSSTGSSAGGPIWKTGAGPDADSVTVMLGFVGDSIRPKSKAFTDPYETKVGGEPVRIVI